VSEKLADLSGSIGQSSKGGKRGICVCSSIEGSSVPLLFLSSQVACWCVEHVPSTLLQPPVTASTYLPPPRLHTKSHPSSPPLKKTLQPRPSLLFLTPPLTETPKAEHRTSPRQPLLPLPHAGARTRPTLLRYTDGHLYGRAPRRPTKSPQPERGFRRSAKCTIRTTEEKPGSIANFFSGLVYT